MIDNAEPIDFIPVRENLEKIRMKGFGGLLEVFARHANGIEVQVRYGSVSQEANAYLDPKPGYSDGTITVHEDPSLAEIVSLNRELGVTDVSGIGMRLQDVAVLLARDTDTNSSPLGLRLAEFITYLYTLGQDISISFAHATPIPTEVSLEEVRKASLHLPEGSDENRYIDELYLYMLGKYDRSIQADESTSPNYHGMYLRWLGRKSKNPIQNRLSETILEHEKNMMDLAPDSYLSKEDSVSLYRTRAHNANELREEFEQAILRHKSLLIHESLQSLATTGELSPRSQDALLALVQTSAQTATTQGIVDHGMVDIADQKDGMKLPPKARLQQYLDPALYEELIRIFPDIAQDTNTLFRTVEKLMENEKSEPSDKRRLEIIWEVLQSYEYQLAYSLTNAKKNRAFECALRALMGRELIRTFIPRAQVASIDIYKHVFLGVKIGEAIYPFDATATRESNWNSYTHQISGLITPAQSRALRTFFQTGMPTVLADPDHYSLGGFCSINDADRTLQTSLINSIASMFVKESTTKQSLRQLGLQINPNNAMLWYNLGLYSENIQDKISCYRRALEINPNYADSIIALQHCLPESEEKTLLCLRFLDICCDRAGEVQTKFSHLSELIYETKQYIMRVTSKNSSSSPLPNPLPLAHREEEP